MKNSACCTLMLCLLVSFSCSEKVTDLEYRIVLSDYFEGVNSHDPKKLSSCLIAFDDMKNQYGDVGGAIKGFTDKFNELLDTYESSRNEGNIEFDDWGVAATRIMGLGRGLYYNTVEFEIGETEGYIILSHSFKYDEMDYSIFPKGTTLFFLGCPIGKIYKITTGEYTEEYRKYLKSIHTKWFFKKSFSGKWKIDHMEVLPETAVCEKSFRGQY